MRDTEVQGTSVVTVTQMGRNFFSRTEILGEAGNYALATSACGGQEIFQTFLQINIQSGDKAPVPGTWMNFVPVNQDTMHPVPGSGVQMDTAMDQEKVGHDQMGSVTLSLLLMMEWFVWIAHLDITAQEGHSGQSTRNQGNVWAAMHCSTKHSMLATPVVLANMFQCLAHQPPTDSVNPAVLVSSMLTKTT